MTVSTTNITNGSTGDGVTTTFPFTFNVQFSSDVQVYVNGVLQISGYSVTLNSNGIGGYVIFGLAPANAAALIFNRIVPLTQTTHLVSDGVLSPAVLEKAYDKLTMVAQQIQATGSAPVTSVTGADSSVAVSPVIGTVQVSLPTTGVSAGTYNNSNITVNNRGIITSASNGSGGGSVSSVASNNSSNVTVFPTTGSVLVDLASTAVTPGSYTSMNGTVDSKGRLTSVSSGGPSISGGTGISVGGATAAPVITNTGVISVSAGTNVTLSGTSQNPVVNATNAVASVTSADSANVTVTPTTGAVTVDLPATAVTPGSYTNTNLTVDAKGRITTAANGSSASGVSSVGSAGGSLTVTPTTGAVDVSMPDTSVTPGSYTLTNLTVDAKGRITAAANGTSGGGGGVVDSVSAGDSSVTVTPTTGSVGISLPTSGVTAASYTYGAFTVNNRGIITAASSGTAPVTSVTGTAARISSSGGATPVLDLINTAVTPGSYTYGSFTVDAAGRLTAASSGTAPVTSVTAGDGSVTISPTTGAVIANLPTSGASAGSYTNADITINSKGIVTAAANGSAGGGAVSSVTASDSSVTITPTTGAVGVALPSSGVSANTYTNATVVVNAKGIVTSASNGSTPVTGVTGTASNISSSGGATPAIDLISTAVTPGSYTNLNATIDAKGRITAASNGTGGSGTTFTSADQTITTAGALTLAHSLSATPKLIWYALVCQTAQNGYSIGDVVSGTFPGGSTNQGMMYTADATNVYAIMGSVTNPFSVLNKTTGSLATATNANWKVRIYAQ